MPEHGKTTADYRNVIEQRAGDMRWNDDGSCPICGEYDNRDPFGSKVCPNCGAKMAESAEFEVIRGEIDGDKKYCRIPIRSNIAIQMEQSNIVELNADIILSMPHDQAVKVIDAIMQDWLYWLRRSGEMFVRLQAMGLPKEG